MRTTLALLILTCVAATAEAGPFRRSVVRSTTQTCTSGACGTSVERTSVVARGRSAQDIAEAMAASGSLVHASSHPGYEGVGTGGTPEAAVRSCCTNGGQVIDQGVAQSSSGRWFACVRRR